MGQRRREALLALAASEADADVVWRVDYALRLATEQLKFGQANEAVRLLDNALEIEEANGADPERLDEILDALVVAHIRQGENDNCTTPDGRFTCLLPLDGGA
ncbi:MAG: hypothetical protein FJ317_05770, partial [SAR202 cluster bacterium]|nr:hypothetical protein [SAR202 cluster bacterium]